MGLLFLALRDTISKWCKSVRDYLRTLVFRGFAGLVGTVGCCRSSRHILRGIDSDRVAAERVGMKASM